MNPDLLILFLAFIFGLCVGSFLNVVIWRMPKAEKLTGRSHCANCGHNLGAEDLVPVLSFIVLKRCCRYCGKKISFRYPLIEIITGTLFAFAFFYYRPENYLSWLVFIKSLIIISVLFAVFVIDLEHFLILDSITIPSALLLVLVNVAIDSAGAVNFLSLHSSAFGGLISGLLAALPFFLIWLASKGKWMGFGDVKFAVWLGIALGSLVWVDLFLAVILGGISGMFLMLFAGKNLKTKLPFGVFLSVAGVITLFYGKFILGWYLGILGI